MEKNQYYLVRCEAASVFAGYIKERNGREVTMTEARRIWYWDGAASLSQLAMEGVKKPGSCKFAMPLKEVVLLDAIEIMPMTKEAERNVKDVTVWKI